MYKIFNHNKWFVSWMTILAVLGVIALLVSTRSAHALFSDAHGFYVLLRVDSELLRQTPAGRYYRALIWRGNDELIRLHYQYPEQDVHLFEALDLYIPGLEALMEEKGETVTITAEQVNALVERLDWLASVAEDPVRSDILRERERFPLTMFVGMTMQAAWDYINANWRPNSPEEQALSEFSTQAPATPEYISPVELSQYTLNGVSIGYPEDWSARPADPNPDGNVSTVFFDPPADSAYDPQADIITLRVLNLSPDERGTPEPSFSEPAGDGYAVLWQEGRTVGNLTGVTYVWGNLDETAVLYARFYAEQQLAIQLSVNVKAPSDLKVFGFRYMLGANYFHFGRMVNSLKIGN
jgi:hypothetical protein